MSLLEEVEEIKKQLADAGVEQPLEDLADEEGDQSDDDVVDATAQESEPEQKAEEPAKTDADFARERREKKLAENSRIAELEAKLAEQERLIAESKNTEPQQQDVEPDRQQNYEAWLEWKDRQNEREIQQLKSVVTPFVEEQRKNQALQAAVQELNYIEAQTKERLENYDEVSKFYTDKLTESFKMLYPTATDAQIGKAVAQRVLQTASQYARSGYNPIEQMYQDALDSGFTPSAKEAPPAKADIKKVAQNQKRNAGTGAARGNAESGDITAAALADMTVAEFAAQSRETRDKIIPNR